MSSNQQVSPLDWQPLHEYNFEHYQAKHLLLALRSTLRSTGIQPGQAAPDFELESTEGERLRLSKLRGKPVVLRFGSFT